MHVFDGTYGDAGPLIAWARKRIARGATDSAMTVLYIPGSGTAPQAQRVAKEVCAALVSADPALKERFRVESTRTGHNDIPQVFGWRLLVDPAAPLPGATRRSCGSGRSGELEALDETGEAVHASYAELEQDLASVGDESEDLVWPFATTKPTTPGKDRARGVVTYSRPTATDAKKAHPGTLKLAQMWKRLSGIKAGTYNYRLTTFGTRSAHGEGRAIDCYAKASVPAERMMAEAFIEWMQDNAVELQVSVIIWNKRIWAWHRRAQGWRHYRGNPPTDHIHVELSWEGALHPSPLFDTTPFSVTPYGQVVKAVGRGIGGVAGVRGMFEDEELEAEGFDTEGFTLELFEPESFEPESFELFEPEDLLLDLDAEEEAGGRWSAQEGPDLEEESDRGRGVVRRGAFRACAGKAQPGAKALAGQRTRWTGRKAGIYNCRATVFGSPSLHGEGRAVDCYARADDPAQRRQAETYVAWLTANAVELQVAVVIWNRRVWAWHLRNQGWRVYKGDPHTDHIHVELSWEGATTPSALFSTAPSGAATAPSPTLGPAPSPSPVPAPTPGKKATPAQFVQQYAALAADNLATHGVPVLVTLGQAALESGWAQRAAGFNFFGIKAKASDPSVTRRLWRTKEVLRTPNAKFPEVISVTPRADGRYDYVVRDWFRAYPSAREAFLGHGAFLRRNKRYAPAFQTTEPFAFASAVARAGYATAPTYESVLHNVMRTLQKAGAS